MRAGERPTGERTFDGRPRDPARAHASPGNPPHGLAGATGAIPGVVFVLAAGGLRHLGGSGFLGYPPQDLFWMDVLDLVHKDDLARVMVTISEVIDHPGTSLSIRCPLRDASENFRVMDASFQNVLEAPGDTGLVVAAVRETGPRASDGRSPYAAQQR